MEICVTKKQQFGQGCEVNVVIDKAYVSNLTKNDKNFCYFLNGSNREAGHYFSRKFTNTTNETANGVFTLFGLDDENEVYSREIEFNRPNGAMVTMQYDSIEFDQLTANEILQIIVDRINAVNTAFVTKYPGIDEIAIAEMPIFE